VPVDECSKLDLMKTIFGGQPLVGKIIAKVFLSFCLSSRFWGRRKNSEQQMKAGRCVIKK